MLPLPRTEPGRCSTGNDASLHALDVSTMCSARSCSPSVFRSQLSTSTMATQRSTVTGTGNPLPPRVTSRRSDIPTTPARAVESLSASVAIGDLGRDASA